MDVDNNSKTRVNWNQCFQLFVCEESFLFSLLTISEAAKHLLLTASTID